MTRPHSSSTPRGEFERIDAFLAHFSRAKVPVGAGDDCAVVRVSAGHELCVTTDAVVEDVHFTRGRFRPEEIGHKALAVNLSDLAAMGARPAWFVCALEVSRHVTDQALEGIARGMSALARQHRIALVGGNFSRAHRLSLTLTVAGEVPRGQALLRSGGRPGDLLYVSGTLGDARAGLEVPHWPELFARQTRPQPRVALGLLARRYASAAIDLSDGFTQDLGHLLQASKAGARVRTSALPTSAALQRYAGRRAVHFALAGGEDYELVLAVPPARARAFEQAARRARHTITHVGELTRGRALQLLDEEGKPVRPPSGYNHFKPEGRRIDRSAPGK